MSSVRIAVREPDSQVRDLPIPRRHPAVGLDWGAGGSAAKNIAFSVLSDHLGAEPSVAVSLAFSRAVVSRLSDASQLRSGEIARWAADRDRTIESVGQSR